jgi:hypothetical protein
VEKGIALVGSGEEKAAESELETTTNTAHTFVTAIRLVPQRSSRSNVAVMGSIAFVVGDPFYGQLMNRRIFNGTTNFIQLPLNTALAAQVDYRSSLYMAPLLNNALIDRSIDRNRAFPGKPLQTQESCYSRKKDLSRSVTIAISATEMAFRMT